MLDRLVYRLALIVMLALAWSAATNLGALLFLWLEPAVGNLLIDRLPRSTTLVPIVGGGLLLFVPLGIALVINRHRVEAALAAGTRPLAGFETAWAHFAAFYPDAIKDAPRIFRRYAPVFDSSPARIDRRRLFLRTDIADHLREGRDGAPVFYDAASFVVLHELAHHRAGDAALFSTRAALVNLLTAVVVASAAFGTLAGYDLSLLAAVPIAGISIVLCLKAVAREIERAADAAAAEAIATRQGAHALLAVARELAGALAGCNAGGTDPFASYPSAMRRLEVLGRPVGLPLAVFWAAALFLLVITQTMFNFAEPRFDVDCADCILSYQSWFDALAMVILAAMTLAVLRVLMRWGATVTPAARWRRVGAVLLAGTAYLAARALGHGPDLISALSSGDIVRVGMVLLGSSDLYARLVPAHLAVCLAAALPAPLGQRSPKTVLPTSDVLGQPIDAAETIRVPPRRRADLLVAAFHGGHMLSLSFATVMLSAAALQAVDAFSTGEWVAFVGTSMNGALGLIALAAYVVKPGDVVIPFRRRISLLPIAYAVEGLAIVFAAGGLALVRALQRIRDETPVAELVIGTQANSATNLNFAEATSQAYADATTVALITAFAIAMVAGLRIGGARVVAIETAGRD